MTTSMVNSSSILSHRLYNRVESIPADDWNSLRLANPSDLFMDLRLLRALEESLPSGDRLRFVILFDGAGRPAASACISTFLFDVGIIAGGLASSALGALRKVSPSLLRPKVIFLGLPISLGQKSLLIAGHADSEAVFAHLAGLLSAVAVRERAALILLKEFGEADLPQTDEFLVHGYQQADSLPMHRFDETAPNFEKYQARLKSHYRADIRRSRRKLDESGFEVVCFRDRETILQHYTPEVHDLYLAVVANSSTRLEVLPIEFFRSLTREYEGEISLTAIVNGDRIVAFNWALSQPAAYQFLFCGLDYELNRSADLYFNLMYADLGHGLMEGRPTILLGQTSDKFKARLGCRAERRYIYVRPMLPAYRGLMKIGFRHLFPDREAHPTNDIYRTCGAKPDFGADFVHTHPKTGRPPGKGTPSPSL